MDKEPVFKDTLRFSPSKLNKASRMRTAVDYIPRIHQKSSQQYKNSPPDRHSFSCGKSTATKAKEKPGSWLCIRDSKIASEADGSFLRVSSQRGCVYPNGMWNTRRIPVEVEEIVIFSGQNRRRCVLSLTRVLQQC